MNGQLLQEKSGRDPRTATAQRKLSNGPCSAISRENMGQDAWDSIGAGRIGPKIWHIIVQAHGNMIVQRDTTKCEVF